MSPTPGWSQQSSSTLELIGLTGQDQPKSVRLETHVFQGTHGKNRLFVRLSLFLKAVLQNVEAGKLPKVKESAVS